MFMLKSVKKEVSMNEMYLPPMLEQIARHRYEALLREAEQKRLFRHAASSRAGLADRAAHKLGDLLIEIAARLQRQRPVL
jgi:hypothetical protein